MIAISGDMRTDAAGTISNSDRFSPPKMSPWYRWTTSRPPKTSSLPANPNVTCTKNGVGRYGKPNGASSSNV